MAVRKDHSAQKTHSARRRERLRNAQRRRPLTGLEPLEPKLLLAFSPLTGPLHGSQAAWVDYDNDGWTDVSTDYALYKNNGGDGTFTQLPGLGEGVWGDYDNDGYPDLFRWADPNSSDLELWHNNNGTGFTDVTSLLPTYSGNFISRGAAWGDFNGDAYLDLYIGGFEGSGSYFADSLLINNAGQSFTASWIQGLDAVVSPGNPRPARGISTLDFDEDNDLDIYVSNYRLEPNALWQNDGNGNITDVGVARGVAGDPGGSYPYGHTIGSAVGDIDNDGHIDIFVGNFRHPWGDGSQNYAKFLRNLGPGGGFNFQLMDELDGNDWQESYASASLADYDNDGDLDLHFTAVYPGDTARLYRNDGNWNFTNVTGTVNLTPYQQNTYQSAWADFDNDGDLDLLTGERLNINDASQQTSNNWLKVKLIGDGVTVNKSAIGAVVRVQAGGQTITRQVESATGEANGNDHTLHFGLGGVSTPVTVDVTWPDGIVLSTVQNPNQLVTIQLNQPPPAPVGITATNIQPDRATISWDASVDPEGDPVTYDVEYRKDDLSDNWSSTLSTQVNSATLKNLESNETYRVRVRASDGARSSDWTEVAGLFTTALQAVSKTVIGEVGQVTDLTHVTQTIILNRDYENPVVFAQSASTNGSFPVSVRVDNVTSNQFDLYLTEPSNEDGLHAEETVNYVVLEAGTHVLADGTQIEVGTVTTNGTVGQRFANKWELVNFETSFSNSPLVLSQIQTASSGGAGFLQTRYVSTTASSVTLALEQEEAITTRHSIAETIGYLAMDAGSGTWNGMTYEAGLTPDAVTSVDYDLNFARSYNSVPRVLTSLASYNSSDSAHLRFSNATTADVQIKVGEDTTFDTELDHSAAETVAYLVIEGDGMLTALEKQQDIGEVGTLTNVTDVPQVVQLNRQYTNPVVFAQSASYNGTDPAVVRVKDVQSGQFTIYLQEPSDQNNTHGVEMVSYVVLEAGSHRLLNGTRLEVGTLSTTDTVGFSVQNQWESISYNTQFPTVPSVFTQVQTVTTGGDRYLHTRQRNATADGVDIALEQEESITTQHPVAKTIGYLAIEQGIGTWGTFVFEAGTTPASVTDAFYDINFNQAFSTAPAFLTSMASYSGTDNALLRYKDLITTGAKVKVKEDTTADTDVGHGAAETVSYLAIGGSGTLLATVPQLDIGEVGKITNLTEAEQTILLDRQYANPVVFAQSASYSGTDPVAVRVKDVQSDRFTIYLQEPADQNNTHGAETVTYMVLEAGTHTLSNGARLEVGTVSTTASAGILVATDQWETVTFSSPFDATPAVFSQIQTHSLGGQRYLNVRYQSTSTSNVLLALEQEEAIRTQHPVAETIGYLAMDRGRGVWSGLAYEVDMTGDVVTQNFHDVNYSQFYAGVPGLLTSLASRNGTDNANVRYTNLSESGVQLKVKEDTTNDTEVSHGAESVAYFVIGEMGLLSAQIPELPPQVSAVMRDNGDDTYDTIQSLAFTFSEDVTVTSDTLQLTNDSTGGTVVNLSGSTFQYDAGSFTATWDLSGVAGITPAFYTATLDATKVSDSSSMNLDGDENGVGGDDYGYTFLVATRGDVDLDGYVVLADFNTLTINYDPLAANAGNNWGMGNFDGDGDIDITDFNEILRSYNPLGYATQAASAASASVASSVAPLLSAPVSVESDNEDSAAAVVDAGDTLVARAAAVKVREERVATDRAFSDLGDDSDETEFLLDASSRRRRVTLPLGSAL